GGGARGAGRRGGPGGRAGREASRDGGRPGPGGRGRQEGRAALGGGDVRGGRRDLEPAVRGLLVAGTTSDAGKSVVTAGLCRWLARRGVKVAPFKAQNISLNAMVTADGAEIGRRSEE